jgi:hypothetical protein
MKPETFILQGLRDPVIDWFYNVSGGTGERFLSF